MCCMTTAKSTEMQTYDNPAVLVEEEDVEIRVPDKRYNSVKSIYIHCNVFPWPPAKFCTPSIILMLALYSVKDKMI